MAQSLKPTMTMDPRQVPLPTSATSTASHGSMAMLRHLHELLERWIPARALRRDDTLLGVQVVNHVGRLRGALRTLARLAATSENTARRTSNPVSTPALTTLGLALQRKANHLCAWANAALALALLAASLGLCAGVGWIGQGHGSSRMSTVSVVTCTSVLLLFRMYQALLRDARVLWHDALTLLFVPLQLAPRRHARLAGSRVFRDGEPEALNARPSASGPTGDSLASPSRAETHQL